MKLRLGKISQFTCNCNLFVAADRLAFSIESLFLSDLLIVRVFQLLCNKCQYCRSTRFDMGYTG